MTADNKDKRYYMIQSAKDNLYWNGIKWVNECSKGANYRDIESLLEQFPKEGISKGDKVVRNAGQPDEMTIYTMP